MSVDHLLDQLVAAAAISPEHAQLARALPANAASTAAGRLEACGLDGDQVLAAVAQVSGLQVAPATLIARARRVMVKGGDPVVLRRLLAYPAGADKTRVLDVLVADPEAATHLPHLGLPTYRVWLAPERVVRELIAKLPESGPDVVTGVEDQMRMLRAIDYDTAPVHTGLELGGAASEEQEQFVTARDLAIAPDRAREAPVAVPLPRQHTPQPAMRAGAPVPRTAATPAHLPRAATPPAAPPRTFTPGTAPEPLPVPMSPRPAAAPLPASSSDMVAAAADLPPAITLLPMMKEVQPETYAPLPRAEPLAKPNHPVEVVGKKGVLVPLLVGGGVVAALGVVAAVLLLGREPAPAGDAALERQRELLNKARSQAAAGDHAYAYASCTDAIAAKPGTTLAVDAELICAKERIELGERLDAAASLRSLIARLPTTDARRAQAEELLRGIVGGAPAPAP
ncbi:MAG: hypothetical protein HYS27_13260 [Deltaproteobacteria bacterium]|nr:hypothetical protein [Deltaproteobacteria bacterium]